MLFRRAGFCAVWGAIAFLVSFSAGEESSPLTVDTEAALDLLRDLPPTRQQQVLQEIDHSRRAGQLGALQIPLLAALVEQSSWTREHRRQLAFLLARLGEESTPTWQRWKSADEEWLRVLGADAQRFQELCKGVAAKDAEQRTKSLQALPEYAATQADALAQVIDLLATAYTSPDEPRRDVRLAALRALVRLGEPAASAIVQSFENPDPFYYQYGKAALSALSPAGYEAMLDGLEHRNPLVRQRVIFAFRDRGIDEEAAAAMRRLENDRDELVRKAVARALLEREWRAKANPSNKSPLGTDK